MRRQQRITRVGCGPCQGHELPAPVGRLDQHFEPNYQARRSSERMLTGNRGELGKVLQAGSVTCRPQWRLAGFLGPTGRNQRHVDGAPQLQLAESSLKLVRMITEPVDMTGPDLGSAQVASPVVASGRRSTGRGRASPAISTRGEIERDRQTKAGERGASGPPLETERRQPTHQ